MPDFSTVYRGRGIRFRAIATLNGRELDINGGTITGTIGRPLSASLNVSYDSITSHPLGREPVTIRFQMESGDFSEEVTVFEGELAQIGRDKHEQNRSITLTCEGYSAIWFRSALYLVNELAPSGLSYGDAFRARAVGDPVGYTAAKRMSDLSNLLDGDLPAFISAVVNRTPSGEAAAFNTNVLTDTAASDLFSTGDTLRRIFIKLVEGQTSSISPVITFLQSILEVLYYEMVDRPGPAPGGRVLFKPRTIFTPVAAANVFRPENYSHFRETRSLVDAPTRMMFQTNAFLETAQSGKIDVSTLIRFAPATLQSQFDAISRGGSRTPEELTRVLSNAVTDEEIRRGIVAEYGAISPAEWLIAQGLDGAAGAPPVAGINAVDAALGDLAEYKLRLKQLNYRSASVNHAIEPKVALGFPGAIIDDQFNVLGLVSSVSHAFSVEGVSTQIGMSYTRFEGEGADAANPPWLNPAYVDGSAYSVFTGSGTSTL